MSAQVAADLRAAADVLERDGWTQGKYHAPDGCHCVQGAIAVAIAGQPEAEPSDARDVDDAMWPDSRWDRANAELKAHVGYRQTDLWNDTPGRTAAEVIATLRAAAVLAEAEADQ